MVHDRLADRLYQQLSGLIEDGTFGEGCRLPAESELADRFSVSRPVIREALSRLRTAGLIQSRRGAGSFVQSRADQRVGISESLAFGPISSLAHIRRSYEFRLCVESEAAHYAALNRTPEALVAIRAALGRLDRAIATGELGVDADYEFHAAVAHASGNEFFEGVMRSMRTPFEFTINLARSLALRWPGDHLQTVQAEHHRIFSAIEARDTEAARAAMRSHVENSRRRVFDGPNKGGGLLDYPASE